MATSLTEDRLSELRETFSMFDKDMNGSISTEELSQVRLHFPWKISLDQVLKAMGQKPTEMEVKDMIGEADADGNGTIEFPEFLPLMEK